MRNPLALEPTVPLPANSALPARQTHSALPDCSARRAHPAVGLFTGPNTCSNSAATLARSLMRKTTVADEKCLLYANGVWYGVL